MELLYDPAADFEEWLGKGRLWDLGHVRFGVHSGNIPREARPVGESFFVITQPGEDSTLEIEKGIKRRYSRFPNSYLIPYMSTNELGTQTPGIRFYEVQAYETDEEWLRSKWFESIPTA